MNACVHGARYCILALLLWSVSSQASVDLGLNVPATSSTGNYTVTWDCCDEIELQELQGGTYYGIYIGTAAQKSFTNI